ncbi:hypothetical protein F383_22803 [Gossypium arboreum]|uniref:Uncharacterized protein n=1 Tax=Gossypium arboreum TaxID=29729 RepID=A0A0B0NUT0_GOSAR|nr:hypothetical protein F383_22803 [Gossypium arboreum]
MGQHGKSIWPGLPHTATPHDRVYLADSKHSLSHLTRVCPCRAQV